VDITDVARRSGLRASTLRFYEEKGLIASIGRRGLHRVFDPGVLERLALIALGAFRRLFARRNRAHVRARRPAAHRAADASSQSRGLGQDHSQTDRNARRPG
jgi:DNA-binding transcriptional MerR regulator